MIHGHGNNRADYPGLVADFSSNVWYRGIDPALADALVHSIESLVNYPEPDALALRKRVASRVGLSTNNVLITNGSTEAFYLVAQAFAGSTSVIACPSFSEYADACTRFGHRVVEVSNANNSLLASSARTSNMVWLANPNNPDGKTMDIGQIERLLTNNAGTICVLDEAYTELCHGVDTAIPLLCKHENLIIVRSFTKAFAIPGIRLGYILAPERVIGQISNFLMPWNVNSLAITAGMYITDHWNTLVPDTATIARESQVLQQRVMDAGRFRVIPSSCNFFLVQTLGGTARQLQDYLATTHGLLIRDGSNFKGLDNSYFRLAIQRPEMNDLLVHGLHTWRYS